jgi:predicted nucleic acid-binding Zn ribbon protein
MLSRGDNNRPLKEWLQVFAASPQLRERLYQARIGEMWDETMGPLVRQYTRLVRLDGRTLVIRVESASLKAELLQMRELIILRANERLGEDFVTEVRIL